MISENYILEYEQISKSFKGQKVLDEVSLSLKEGDLLGLLGKNGAGKSTMMNIGLQIYMPDSGRVLFDVEPSDIGVMPDAPSIFPNLYPSEFMKYMARLRKTNITDSQIAELFELVLLDVSAKKKKKIKTFSFGMRKKIMLAQALIGEPKLLVLDEPTSGIDLESAIRIRDLVADYNKRGTSVFISSHNLQEIQTICNRVVVLKGENIVLDSPVSELVQDSTERIDLHIVMNCALSDYHANCIPLGMYFNKESGIFSVEGRERIPELIHWLVNLNYLIYEVRIQSRSLEEVFLDA